MHRYCYENHDNEIIFIILADLFIHTNDVKVWSVHSLHQNNNENSSNYEISRCHKKYTT